MSNRPTLSSRCRAGPSSLTWGWPVIKKLKPKRLTHSGVTLGTFDYISPEQAIEPREVDVRSDIYSLGCTFYHMVTGRPSVPEGTAAKKLHHHQHVLPIDPRQHNDEIPDDVAAVLAHMMAKDPKDRYQTAEELLRDLSRVAAGSSGGRSTETHEPLGFPIGARHRWRPVMLGAVAAGALFGLVTIHELSSNVAPHRTLTSMPPLANSPADKPSLPQATVASNAKHAEERATCNGHVRLFCCPKSPKRTP